MTSGDFGSTLRGMVKEPLGDRVWRAYWSLPRSGKRNKPPSFKSLETAAGLPNGIISKLIVGDRQSAAPETLHLLASALQVSPAWLAWGEGPAPTPSGTVPPRTLAATAEVEESGEVQTLAPQVTPAVQRAVLEAVERALLEAAAKKIGPGRRVDT